MEIISILLYTIGFLASIFFVYLNIKYFKTMWRYKNRKKDGSEDKDFKMLD